MSYSRTAFSIFFSIFSSLCIVALCTGSGFVVDAFILVTGMFGKITSVSQSGPVDPSSLMQSLFNFNNPALLIGPGIGLMLGLLLAILISSARLKRTADVNWLEKHGKRIMAVITSINRYRGTSTNASTGQRSSYTYYIITAEWVDPQTRFVHSFRSGELSSPRTYQVGGAVQVWIDPENISKYVMYVA